MKARGFPTPLQWGMPGDDGRARGPPLPDEGDRIKQEGRERGLRLWVRKAWAHLGSDTDFRCYPSSLGLTTFSRGVGRIRSLTNLLSTSYVKTLGCMQEKHRV